MLYKAIVVIFSAVLLSISIVNDVDANYGTVIKILNAFRNELYAKTKLPVTHRSILKYRRISRIRYSAARNIRKYNLRIINRQYSGKYYPLNKLSSQVRQKYPNSVRFDRNGYPDFQPYAVKIIRSENLSGTYGDFSIANRLAGYKTTPTNFTWHHHQNGKNMLLIPRDLHESVRHSGGSSFLRHSN